LNLCRCIHVYVLLAPRMEQAASQIHDSGDFSGMNGADQALTPLAFASILSSSRFKRFSACHRS